MASGGVSGGWQAGVEGQRPDTGGWFGIRAVGAIIVTTNHGYVDVGSESINFPGITNEFICWNVELEDWCARNRHHCEHKDPFWVTALMTKDQLLGFLSEVYAPILERDRHRGDAAPLLKELNTLQQMIDSRLADDDRYVVTGFDY